MKLPLRIELLLELKGGPVVVPASDVVAACVAEDVRTRTLAQAVAEQRGIRIIVDQTEDAS